MPKSHSFMQIAAQKPINSPDNITLISSGKGGVGKTWFSITLAHMLAQQKQRILLFDGDLGMANIDVQLGVMPSRNIGHFISGKLALRDTISRIEEAQFDIIAGCSGSASLAHFPLHRLTLMQEELKKLSYTYDHVLIDLGAGIGRASRGLTSIAKQCLIVITDEPTSLTDAYAFIKLNRKENPDLVFEIVVNLVETKSGGLRTYETIAKVCERFLKCKPYLAGIIHRDKCVRDSIRYQSSIIDRHPHSQAVMDVKRLVDMSKFRLKKPIQ